MAKRGPKPKAAHLRLVEGTVKPSRHGTAEQLKAKAEAGAKFGPCIKPAWLKGEAAVAWRKWIEPASWLDASREPAAIAFCELWALFRHGSRSFPAALHSQLRSYQSDLGLTDERNRRLPEKPRDEFFDD